MLGLNLQATCRAGEPVTLRATLEDGRTVTADGDVPQPARNAALTAESLAQRLGKWGGTPYYVKKIDIEIDDGLFLPAAAVNALRREIADRLEAAPPGTGGAAAFTASAIRRHGRQALLHRPALQARRKFRRTTHFGGSFCP